MREIKFRAWAKYGEMLSNVQNHIGNGEWAFGNMLMNPDDFKVMQYTGLKDANGVEIYEGDIVRVWNGNKAIIGHDGFQFCVGKKYRPMQSYEASDMKVIGNIYQNPELLK